MGRDLAHVCCFSYDFSTLRSDLCAISPFYLAHSCGFPHTLKMPRPVAAPAIQPSRPTVRRTLWPWIALLAAWLLIALMAMTAAGEIARGQAKAQLARQAEAAAALHAAVLRSELEKHRSLPVVLAHDPEVLAMLNGTTDALSDRVSAKLELLAEQTRAAVIYVLDASGMARAASNWRLPTSFVGSDYSFRPYFTDAVRDGDAEFFALGTVSGRPGLYLSRRLLDERGGLRGVVVVKVEFDALESEWRASGEPAYVADEDGIVLITSVPAWRFRHIVPASGSQPISSPQDGHREHDDLGPMPFKTPIGATPALLRVAVEGPAADWMAARSQTATRGWTLHLLSPAGTSIRAAVFSARAVAGLLVTLLAVGLAVLLRRRQQAIARAAAEEADRAELERRIAERTLELSTANDDLNREIDERQRAEASREALREELVQATKLATLGQIAAGVAHEINQPVAAIRTHADNAATHIERDDPTSARNSLTRISDLTGRIGSITDELRAFSRKTSMTASAVDPAQAIDGALLLLGGRPAESGVAIHQNRLPGVSVLAERIRLEQVILNLVQNALEALEDAKTPSPEIHISVARRKRRVEISIADNGPGVPPDVVEILFTPFTTTKPNGLGLGLVICRDIIAGFGGELSLTPPETTTGAQFVITLKDA